MDNQRGYGAIAISIEHQRNADAPPPPRPKMKAKEEKRPLLFEGEDTDSSALSVDDPHRLQTLAKPINAKGGGLDSDFDPMMNRDLEHPTSNWDTMIHLLKGNVGTGILAMPDAFRNAGWVVGIAGTLLMGVVCTHCMHMLVRCAHDLCRRTQMPSLSFSDVSEMAFRMGPEGVRSYAPLMRFLINVFLCITQLGFCCVYFVFVAANLHEFVKHYFMDLSVSMYLVLALIPMILLNWVKNLKYLTPASLFASILTCCGLVITFFYMLQGLPNTSTIDAFSTWSQLPLFFGTAIYAFEGIGVVLPLENNMKNPQDFGGWTGVLNTGMVIVACLYTAVGFFGYLRYGERARLGSVTLYLPSDEILAQSVRLMMAIAIFLSYSLQFYVPLNILWPFIRKSLPNENWKFYGEYVTRTILVLVTFCLAAAIPNLGAVISLVGAFSSSALALIFPPIIEIVTFYPDRLDGVTLLKDIAIMVFGVIGFFFGSYVSILNILYPDA